MPAPTLQGPVLLARPLPAGVAPENVAANARHVLAAVGFRITVASNDAVEATSRGLNSTKQNPLLGAGKISLRLGQETATLQANFAGIRKLSTFVVMFPPSLALLMFVWWRLGLPMSKPPKNSAQLLSIAIGWLALSPVVVLWLRQRTKRAVEDFFDGLLAPF